MSRGLNANMDTDNQRKELVPFTQISYKVSGDIHTEEDMSQVVQKTTN